jgi:hypothetical protein
MIKYHTVIAGQCGNLKCTLFLRVHFFMGFPPARETTFGGTNDRARQFEIHPRYIGKITRYILKIIGNVQNITGNILKITIIFGCIFLLYICNYQILYIIFSESFHAGQSIYNMLCPALTKTG